jgi:hypothetical protein
VVDITGTGLDDFHDCAFAAPMQSKNRYDNMVVQLEKRLARLKRCTAQSTLPDNARSECMLPILDDSFKKTQCIIFSCNHRWGPHYMDAHV